MPMQLVKASTPGYKWWVLSAIAVGTFILVVDDASTVVALPTIADKLGTDLPTAQWVLVGYSITIVALLLPMGRLSDIVGRKPVYVGGLIAFVVGVALAGSASDVLSLVLAKVLVGCAAAMTYGTGMAILISAFPHGRRGTVVGYYIGAVGAADLGGPPLAGLIIDTLSWEWMYFSMIPVAAVALLLALVVLDQSRPKQNSHRGTFDWPGAALSAGLLVTFLMTLTSGSTVGWGSPTIIAACVITLVLGASFLFWENRTTSPMLDMKLFKERVVSLGFSSMYLGFLGSASVRFLMPFYLQKVLGFSPGRVGLILVPSAVCFILAGAISGRLSDRYGWRKFTVAGLLLTAASLFLLSQLTESSSLGMAMAGIMLQTSGMATFNSPNNSSILGEVDPGTHGIVAGLLNLVRTSGNVTGVAVSTAIVTATMASMGHPPSLEAVSSGSGGGVVESFTAGIRTAYLALGFVVLVAAALSFMGGGRTTATLE